MSAQVRLAAFSFNKVVPSGQIAQNDHYEDNPEEKTSDEFNLPPCFDIRNPSKLIRERLNVDKLREGITEYNNLTGFKAPGYEVIEHKKEPKYKLKLLRKFRIVESLFTVLFSVGALVGLTFSSSKLFSSAISDSDVDDAYKSLGKAYAASGVAGTLTGIAHESSNWSVGAFGMSIVSYFGLNDIGRLGLFSIFDGLQNIGMGYTRMRDEKNISAVTNSFFNNSKLSFLRFLMPIEQAVLNFSKNALKIDRIFKVEPYATFQEAGGGQVLAGTVLGLASLFKRRLSEGLQSLFYIPYALFSSLSLVAFFRDGNMVLTRANDFGARRKGEKGSMLVEGLSKRAAAPILGLNNILLALKGIGLDFKGKMYHLAMSVRALGAAISFAAFGAQTFKKFTRSEEFGVTEGKEVIKVRLNPDKGAPRVFDYFDQIQKKKSEITQNDDKYYRFIFDQNRDPKIKSLIKDLFDMEAMERSKRISQTGFPVPFSSSVEGRYLYNRFNHMYRVGTNALLFDEIVLKDLSEEERISFIVANFIHDLEHGPFSHDEEEYKEGHDNDEACVNNLKEKNSEVKNVLVKHYGVEKAERMLQQIRDIIGRKKLYQAHKICDWLEYVRTGEFTFIDGFPKWSFDHTREFFKEIRLTYDKKGNEKLVFTPLGGLMMLDLVFDRKLGNDWENNDIRNQTEKKIFFIGLKTAKVSPIDYSRKTEQELKQASMQGIGELNGHTNYMIHQRWRSGGGDSYTGCKDYYPDKEILLTNGMRIGEYIKSGALKLEYPQYYDDAVIKYKNTSTSIEYDLFTEVSTLNSVLN